MVNFTIVKDVEGNNINKIKGLSQVINSLEKKVG
jgi:hypothetical protein